MILKYSRKSDCDTTHLDDEWIILNPDAFTVTKLNEAGGFCWSLLEKEQTIKSLSQAVEKRYQLDYEMNEEDIKEFLSDLISCGLITSAK
jgi:hypothetical protein